MQEKDNDMESVVNISNAIDPEVKNEDKLAFRCKRLGNENSRKPCPLLLEVAGEFRYEVRNKLLRRSKQLKTSKDSEKVYINQDRHPLFRREYKRLNDTYKMEKGMPTNIGCNIIFHRKKKIITKDGIIIDSYKPFLM